MTTAVLCPDCGSILETGGTCAACAEIGDQPTRVTSQTTDLLRGRKLGEYVVGDRIGMGGMGIVYRAHHPLIGNSVAIKVLRPDVISSEGDLQRFLGEARAVNHVRHRGVVSIFGAGDTPDGRKYLVMELLEGESLEARLQRQGRLPPAEVIPIIDEVLAALEAVHAAGVVHRDLKPANVFLARETHGKEYVKLLDFGLARRSNNTEVSRVAGTPDYISPEHARGRPPGPAADLYSLGAMLFHLLTGRVPFVGNNPVAVMEQHVSGPVPNPRALDGNIPPAMAELVMRLMAKDPAARPLAATVRADLDAAGLHLKAAATQLALPAMATPADTNERPTQPGIAMVLPNTPPSPSRDTEPQLAQAGPVITAAASPSDTDPWKVGPTAVNVRAVQDTSPELPPRRWPLFAAIGGLGLIVALSVKVLLDAREPTPEPERIDGRRELPVLERLPDDEPTPPEADAIEAPVPDAPDAPPTEPEPPPLPPPTKRAPKAGKVK
ncbi:MAG: protein kinase [Myxococcaceae bacterium]|nr:protein kinase [Myxococcaceae bacterium]